MHLAGVGNPHPSDLGSVAPCSTQGSMQLQWRHSTGSASHHRSWVLPALGRHRRLCASLPQDRQPEPSRDVPAGEGEHDERGQTAPVTTTMGAAAAHADPSSSTNVGSSSGSVHASTPAQPAEAPSTSSAPAWQRHALALLGSAAAALSTALARLRDSPRWSQAQALRRLREAAEEDPGDPERHAGPGAACGICVHGQLTWV